MPSTPVAETGQRARCGSYAALTDLPVLPLRIVARARTPLFVPVNAASTLRGAFGGALKRLVCVHPDLPNCRNCALVSSCAYPTLFEPRAPEDQAGTSGFRDLPRPYVIRPTRSGAAIPPGETLTWETTLVGRAIGQLAYFALAWRAMGEQGLGRGGGRFDLLRITALDLEGQPVESLYDRETNRLVAPSRAVHGTDAERWQADCRPGETGGRLEVRFLTPTLLKRRGEAQRVPEFAVLWHALQLRLSLLRLAHGGGRPEIDFRGSLERAEGARLVAWQSVDVAWERYSRRQDRRVPMGGFVGTAQYRDVPAEFVPALKLGTLLGIGDNCTFGQGRYEIFLRAE